MKEIIQRIADKCLSGRFILTVIGGIIFAKMTWNIKLPEAAAASILTSIFMSYFQKNREKEKTQ